MTDVFSAPKIGSPRAIGSRYGNTSGTSTDIIYPVSKLVGGQFQSGRTLEFNWKSDKHRFWLPRSTRLVVHYEAKFGEVDSTCNDASVGPASSAGARPSKTIRFAATPNTSLFGTGQARFVQNSVVVDNTNHMYDQAMVQLLNTQNQEGPSTSGSNMLTSLRKDSGLPTSSHFLGSQKDSSEEGFAMLPVVQAPYRQDEHNTSGTKKTAITASTPLGALNDASATDGSREITILVKSGGASGQATFVVDGEFAGVIKVDDSVEVVAAGANSTSLATSPTTVASMSKPAGNGDVTVTLAHNFATGNCEAGVTSLKFIGTTDALAKLKLATFAKGFAVKVKGDTFKNTTPNPKNQILQQGYVPLTNSSTCQVSEPVMLPTWQHNYAIGPSDMSLFLSISPDWQKHIMYDHSGQYGALDGVMNTDGASGDRLPTNIPARTVALRIAEVSLHVAYVHPSEAYIPPSISIRYSPIQVVTRQLQDKAVQETFVVPPSTKSVMIFMRQSFSHLCVDREELSLAGAGINVMGKKETQSDDAFQNGRFQYDNQLLNIDAETDPRLKRNLGSGADDVGAADAGNNIELTRPYAFQSLQCQLGSSIQPREMLTDMNPQEGKMSRAWQLYTEFVGRSQGFRGSVMSYSEFCGYANANYSSGPGAGDRGSFFLFNLQRKPGELATDLQIRGTLLGDPRVDAKQEMVVVAVSDSIYNIGWQSPSETPVLTQVAPIVG